MNRLAFSVGHEVGVHSLAYNQDASPIMARLGLSPKYCAPGFESMGSQQERMKLIQDIFIPYDYKIITGNFTIPDPLDRIIAWQPSFETEKSFLEEDPQNDVLAINQQGMGWVGSNDLDCVGAEQFTKLNQSTPWELFLEKAKSGQVTVYNVAVHEDLFTTGPKMREALATLNEQFPSADPEQAPSQEAGVGPTLSQRRLFRL